MRRNILLTCAFALVIGSSTFAADEAIDLLKDNNLSAFKGKLDDWTFAESVELDKTNLKKLTFTPGKGIAVNGLKGRAADLITKEAFGDVEINMEFMIPKGSNSGIKFHALYEIQIFDSFGKEKLTGADMGGIYPKAVLTPKYMHIDQGIAPKVNACKEPGQWQTLEATFLSPRFDANGKKTTNAKLVIAKLNGKTIHENVELLTPTGHNHVKPEMASGPLMFQGDHGPVEFRNLKVRKIEKAK